MRGKWQPSLRKKMCLGHQLVRWRSDNFDDHNITAKDIKSATNPVEPNAMKAATKFLRCARVSETSHETLRGLSQSATAAPSTRLLFCSAAPVAFCFAPCRFLAPFGLFSLYSISFDCCTLSNSIPKSSPPVPRPVRLIPEHRRHGPHGYPHRAAKLVSSHIQRLVRNKCASVALPHCAHAVWLFSHTT